MICGLLKHRGVPGILDMKITDHFKKRYAGRRINFEHLENALKVKPEKQPGGRLKYIGPEVTAITDKDTEHLITCYTTPGYKSPPLEKKKNQPKKPCAVEGCKRKAWKIGPYCGKHFKPIK